MFFEFVRQCQSPHYRVKFKPILSDGSHALRSKTCFLFYLIASHFSSSMPYHVVDKAGLRQHLHARKYTLSYPVVPASFKLTRAYLVDRSS